MYLHGHGAAYELPSQCKLLATLVFITAVVLTPREAWLAFALYVLLLACMSWRSHVPFAFVARRLVLETPFVLFIISIPFVGGGRRIDVAGASLSVEGLWAAWNVGAKATLALCASIILAATTTTADLLHGLEHLRFPRSLTAIARFMIRYADIIGGELDRMRIARLSRGYSPRFIWQAKAVAMSAGALFIRSFERGERVHNAMLSRGFDGSMPVATEHAAAARDWTIALTIPFLALCVSAFHMIS